MGLGRSLLLVGLFGLVGLAMLVGFVGFLVGQFVLLGVLVVQSLRLLFSQ